MYFTLKTEGRFMAGNGVVTYADVLGDGRAFPGKAAFAQDVQILPNYLAIVKAPI